MSPSSGGGSGGDRIEVDPQVLIRSGQRLGAIGTQLGMLSDAATPILNSGIASGLDYAGLNFGLEYSDLARQLAPGLAAVANGAKALGLMLEASGYNYENSDAASTIGGTGPAGGVSGQPSETISASVPSGPNGIGVFPPDKWALVYPFIQFFGGMAMTWPSGHPEMMRLLAEQWRNIATGLAAFDDDMAALKTAASTQNIPEGAKIQEKLTTLQTNLADLATSTSGLADRIEEFAVSVKDTQDAIRRILDRLSLDGLIDTVTGFFTGEGDDILRQVGRDIGQLLENFQNQIKGIVGLLGQLKDVIGDAVTALQDLVRPFLVATFGEDVGGALATTFEYYTDFQVGVVNGLLNTVAGTVSMLDADTWKGMADMAMQVAEDPSKLDDVLLNMGKQFIAYDALTGDNPARGLGEAGFNIGLLFVPGGAASKTGTLAKSISATSRMLEKGELPRLGELPGFRDRTPSLDGLPGAGRGLPDVPEFRPGAVPDSVIAGPHAPNAIDPPSTPRGFDGPAGPPDPPGPTTTPGGGDSGSGGGGDGPPPDSPGRPVSPSDSGPGRIDGPAAQPPTPSGPGSVDSPRISEPSTPSQAPSGGDPTPSATQHAPENPSPANTHEPARSPSESSPTHHTPPTPESSHGNGSPTEHRQPVGNDAPSEHHRPGANEYTGRPVDGTHTPASQQPAHTPTVEQPSLHDRPSTDGTHTREQTQTPGVAGTPMVGTPMAPHAPAGAHSPVGSHDPASRTPSSEAPARTPEARAPQSNAPESPRAQAPTATGPATGNAPAPVDPAARQPSAGATGQPMHPATESSVPTQPFSNSPNPPPDNSQPNNPPHTGLHDPPTNHGIAGDHLPDLSSINREFRLANGVVDPDRFDEWTRAVSDAYPRISEDGVAGVYDYTTENYQGMNPYLRDIDPLSPEQQSILGADSIDHMADGQRSAWEERISNTDDGLAALPPYRAEPADDFSTTWRGMHASDDLLAQLEVGDHFEDAAYLSTSLDSKVAEDFARSADPSRTPTLLSIEGYDGVDVSQLSRYTDEAEILFPRGSRFEVISRDVGDDGLIRIVLRQIQP